MTGGWEDFPGALLSPDGLREKAEIPRIFRQGAGGGLFARAAQKVPCVIAYLSPPRPVGYSREFCEKRGFRKIPLRGAGHPGRQHIRPPTPPASPIEPERGGDMRRQCPKHEKGWGVAVAFALSAAWRCGAAAFYAERGEGAVKRARRGKAPSSSRHSPGNRGIHAFKN